MAYYIDDASISLSNLLKRIETTDLIPSRGTLLDGIENNFFELEKQGITTLAALRKELKSNRRLENISVATGIDSHYLILLRREIESYFPSPYALNDFFWLPKEEITKLVEHGLRDTAALYNTASSAKSIAEFAESISIDVTILETLIKLADLTRVQWVSPNTARMLVEAGFNSASKLASADSEDLCNALMHVNADYRFFKGKIGLRDVKRLIHAACYLPS
jgi:hypothetical protein